MNFTKASLIRESIQLVDPSHTFMYVTDDDRIQIDYIYLPTADLISKCYTVTNVIRADYKEVIAELSESSNTNATYLLHMTLNPRSNIIVCLTNNNDVVCGFVCYRKE